MKPEKITIMDIARRTGLSKGTVDRVLHNRSEVSAKSREKVMSAIRELGYEPNLHASLLASGKQVRIVLLIPSPASGSFWTLSAAGLEQAAETVGPLGVKLECETYDQYDLTSFRLACDRLLRDEPSGVVLAPMFRYESYRFAESLSERGIPFTLIDTKLDHDAYLAYFGMSGYQSGYLCADQLTGGKPIESALVVRVLPDRDRQSDPTEARRSGFTDYLSEHSPGCRILECFIDPSNRDQTDRTLDEVFAAHPGLRHIVMFNSRIYGIVPWLEDHPQADRRVVGFDNLEANLAALRSGTVSVLIAQRPGEQVARAVQALTDWLLMDKKPARKDNHMHMDILTRYNIEYY